MGRVQQANRQHQGVREQAVSYHCILADPPWLERGGGQSVRGAQRHYSLLHTPDIIRTIVRSEVWRPHANAHLWLWVTNNFLAHGLSVVDALGFRYVTNAVWVKDRMGLGQYLRGQHELLLFCVRGRLPSLTRRCSTVIVAPRGRHSAKPEAAYELVEQVSPGPRLELFARTKRDGWDAFGDEL